MSDNIVQFPGTSPDEPENSVTPETIIDAARDRYSELILIGKNKETNTYECVSSMDIPETLYHVTRIQHRLNLFLDGG
jgi:hypothetical protein